MPEHEPWCCLSPKSPCALNGGCSGSCNCGADESLDACRPVTLPSGETIRVRGAEPMNAAAIAAFGEVLDAVRRRHTAEHPPNPAAEALWARLEACGEARDVRPRQAAHQAGVSPAVMYRIAQGHMPGDADSALIEAWLTKPDED